MRGDLVNLCIPGDVLRVVGIVKAMQVCDCCVCVREGEREIVCVRERVCVCVREREREGESVCV